MVRFCLLSASVLALVGTQGAIAAPAATPTGGDGTDGYHTPVSPEIVVTALQRPVSEILSGVSVLQGTDLTRELRPTIGDMLAHQPGVSSTSFGPNVSRPVLRGFQGDRIRVLTDGIGSIDASNTSVDHAVVINPLTAERVEVLRGPSSLLYGSSAIGGVVNVIDKRIPREVPDEPVHVDMTGTLGSAANERSIGGSVDAPVNGKIVLHADGSYLKTGDVSIGGHVLSKPLREQAIASGIAEIEDLADLDGKIENTQSKTWQVAAGASVITETGNLGFSVSHYDSMYGVPSRLSLDPAVEAESPVIDLKQTRLDARGEVDANGSVIDKISVRAGYAHYRHYELEEDGSIGTAFYNDGVEGRLELTQAKHGVWSGVTGGQLMIRDFDVQGEEAFLPKNETQQYGVFTLQTFDFGRLKAEAGARYEYSTLAADAIGADRHFNAVSASAGASYELATGWRLGANVSRTERAPTAEELFANGPHAGTEAYQIGDTNLRMEKSWGLEGVLRGSGEGYHVEVSAFYNRFSNFIYDVQNGEIEDDLPVYETHQGKATYYGFEIDGSLTLATLGEVKLVADGVADYVHAQVRSIGPAPRIPPLRLLGGLEAQSDKVDGRVEVEWVDDQDRTAAYETRTNGYTMVNSSIAFRPWGRDNGVSVVLSANNIFDVNARRHASYLKDYAPLAGRDFRLSVRASF